MLGRNRSGTRGLRRHRPSQCWVFAALMPLALTGCGGGGGSEPAAAPASGSYEKSVAQHVYAGTPRTPAGFYTEPQPAGVTGAVAMLHLKNTDVMPTVDGRRYELCTDDGAQAIQWSEMRPSFQGSYADLIELNGDERLFEIVRVPRADSTSRLVHRVFRCSYLDRSTTDLDAPSGAAGTVNRRPLDLQGLRMLSEYLWRFAAFNNADHVVLASAASQSAPGHIAHAIEMARLTRASSAGECDRIDVLRWTHTVDTATGAAQRELATLRSFRARRDSLGDVMICS